MKNYYEFNCQNCGKKGKRPLKDRPGNKNWKGSSFCDRNCMGSFYKQTIQAPCGWCNAPVERMRKEFNNSKSGLIFCNRSCSTSYNNTQKRKSRRSKCEKILFQMLVEKYTSLEFIPNDKTALNGLEIDIFIPSLKVGIEWNGIVHFKPIYGQAKLDKIQSKDQKKLEIANQNKINLIVIPDLVSSEKYIKEAFLEICKIIETLI